MLAKAASAWLAQVARQRRAKLPQAREAAVQAESGAVPAVRVRLGWFLSNGSQAIGAKRPRFAKTGHIVQTITEFTFFIINTGIFPLATNANFSCWPTTARVVMVDGFGPTPRGTLQMPPTPLVWPVKDPRDILDYVIDYSEALAGNCGDAIATLDVSLFPNETGDLNLTMSSADGDQAILWLAGGQPGTTYAVTVVVGTNSGRSIARTVSLPVAALAASVSPDTAITDEAGKALTDQAGTPITVS